MSPGTQCGHGESRCVVAGAHEFLLLGIDWHDGPPACGGSGYLGGQVPEPDVAIGVRSPRGDPGDALEAEAEVLGDLATAPLDPLLLRQLPPRRSGDPRRPDCSPSDAVELSMISLP